VLLNHISHLPATVRPLVAESGLPSFPDYIMSAKGYTPRLCSMAGPTLVHFGSVLFLALAVLAPWPSAWPIGIILGLDGLAGLAYQIHVILTRKKVSFVLLDWLDWIPWMCLPVLCDASLIAGAVGLIAGKAFAPYAVAGSSALLLFAGMYGAWDLTVWMMKNRDKT
jgi:hypothetical protein